MVDVKDPINILLIEDNPGDAGLFETFFEQKKRKCNFAIARDGEEALDYMRRTLIKDPAAVKPSVIVLDINIPKIDGKEVLRELKKDPAFRKIPVVVLTSSESEDDIRESYERGASSVLIKPSDVEAVSELLRSIEQYWCNCVRYAKS